MKCQLVFDLHLIVKLVYFINTANSMARSSNFVFYINIVLTIKCYLSYDPFPLLFSYIFIK